MCNTALISYPEEVIEGLWQKVYLNKPKFPELQFDFF